MRHRFSDPTRMDATYVAAALPSALLHASWNAAVPTASRDRGHPRP